MALTTTDDCIRFLGISKKEENHLIDAIREAAEATFNLKINRVLEPNSGEETYTEYHDGDGRTGYFYTDHYPIATVVHLYDDTGRDYESDSEIDADDFTFYDSGRVELDGSVFSEGNKNIKIELTVTREVPGDVQYAVWELVAAKYNKSKSRNAGVASRSAGGEPITFRDEDIPASVMSVIKQYRKVPG